MRVSLVSMNQAWEDKERNMNYCRAAMIKAKNHQTDLVVFPEMTLTGFSMNASRIREVYAQSTTIKYFKKLSEEFKIGILFGVVIKDNDKATNNAILIDSLGELLGSYSKIHPFSLAGEDRVFNGGNSICITQFKNSKIGITICYDLRFPELYSALARHCSISINIANWPARRIEHWRVLLRARAIENQIFIIGVNRTGVDGNGLRYEPSSLVIDPAGEFLTPLVSEGDVDTYNVDPELINEYRKSFQTASDRKVQFYKSII